MGRIKRIVVGISGASGPVLGHALLQALKRQPDVETHVVITEAARKTWVLETGRPEAELEEGADVLYDEKDMAARIASGSFVTDGMVICPCSMKTLAGVVSGFADSLLLRAADVTLKEGRKLVLVPREMPLGKVHLRNLKEAGDLGCVIMPPMLTFYSGQETVQDMISHITGKILRQFGLQDPDFHEWKGGPTCSVSESEKKRT